MNVPSRSGLVALVSLTFVFGSACGSRPTAGSEAASSPSLPPPEASSACDALRQRAAEEMCDPSSTEVCAAESLACELVADFDGDGRDDRVELAQREGGEIGLDIHWATGSSAHLEEGAPAPTDEDGRTIDTFGWMVGWHVLRAGDAGHRAEDASEDAPALQMPDALGDAIWLTSTDAAVTLRFTEAGWRMEHLGY